MVKHLPAIQSLGWEDLLERATATHSSILAWRIPWTEEPGGPQSMEKSVKRRAWWARVHGEIHGQKDLGGQTPRGCRVGQD